MKEAFQILHIPSGCYISSKNREAYNNAVVFADLKSAEAMIQYIITQQEYMFGAPSRDFYIGDLPLSESFVEAEFICIPAKIYNVSKIL